ncbi:EscT/YscT/HrcT family type III secretion system export apparatus protein [Sphingomonas populi]|uniref:EscT/YscT/HrcT family type III secretion system export apparatus protein n=1 Tax=Sphingomonas populi TaxID=2484750 RepID=A0A4V2DDI9_9SPHN|nr:type III secretion system export apparatus subunit SctT [Sphingomonas populi]RZF65148.1 EscT/YscT/HrcT family type III secretion system export apparatus protein [Sphingomonas populi]
MTPAGGAWFDQLLLVAVASARFGFAFALVPMFAQDLIPSTVRNCIILTLGGVAFVMQPHVDPATLGAFGWVRLLLKEAVVGIVIGFFFGTMLWALEAAGEIIDAKIGSTIGQIVEPLGGNQTSLNGALLARLANVIFMSVGGLSLFVGAIMQSYAVWPMAADWPDLDMHGLLLFEGEFGRLVMLAMLFAAPVLTLLYVIDAGLGLLNRFAQQLNVFTLSLSLKSWAATLLLITLIPAFAQAVIAEVASRNDVARQIVGVLAR